MSDEKKHDLKLIDGAGESTSPRPADMRAAAKGLEPFDLDNCPGELEPDGKWLWHALGQQLIDRGYLKAIHRVVFFGLCAIYTQRREEPEIESVFVDYLRDCGATLEMVKQLEAGRNDRG